MKVAVRTQRNGKVTTSHVDCKTKRDLYRVIVSLQQRYRKHHRGYTLVLGDREIGAADAELRLWGAFRREAKDALKEYLASDPRYKALWDAWLSGDIATVEALTGRSVNGVAGV